MKGIDLSKIHDCEKCHGKMVFIDVDKLGNTYCSYCHEKVDYSTIKLEVEDIVEYLKQEYNFTKEEWDEYLDEK